MKTLYGYVQDAMALGFHIFPLGVKAKTPTSGLTHHGFKDSSADPIIIAKWWKINPELNFGINCGDSGIAVSDIDTGLNSLEEFQAWFKASGLPPTYTVRTGRRNAFGVHMYWKGTMPSSGSKKWSLNGCTGEVKSVGGYVVGVGSIHPDSGERWEVICDAPLAALPDLVRDSVTRAAATAPVVALGNFLAQTAVAGGGKIPPGNWHNLLVSFAGKAINAGITSPIGLYRAMVAYAEDNFDFSTVPLDKEHVKQIAVSAAETFEAGPDTSVSADWTRPEEVTGDAAGGAAEASGAAAETAEDIAQKINAILRTPGLSAKNPDGMTDREKEHVICRLIFKHLKANGKLFNCGNVATFVENKQREIIQITKGNHHFTRLLMRYGVYPADKLTPAIGMFLGGMATTAPENTVYTMSHYNRSDHVLYVNEYGGNFLKINPAGTVTRLRNGDDDMLFSDGKDAQCDTLIADLEKAALQAKSSPLALDAGAGMIKKEILDTINYSDEGVGKENSQLILLLGILALFFHERIPSMPQFFLLGQGASMKTSLAVKVGHLVQGRKFKARPATDDDQALKDMAMSLPFLVLDEANQVKKLTNVLKTIATGAIDSRRELYTTANMRHTPYQSRIWMTANSDSLVNETITKRLMIIDAAARTEAEPYCSEHYLVWNERTRNAIWTELVGRLSAAMRGMTLADAKGEGNLHVSHRMSSFFVPWRALAREHGVESKLMDAMNAMDRRQSNASAQDNEILSLISRCPASYNIKGKAGMRTAEEWAGIFTQLVPEANYELRGKVSRPGWVRFQFMNNVGLLKERCGLVESTTLTPQNNRIKIYGFKFGCASAGISEQILDQLTDLVL